MSILNEIIAKQRDFQKMVGFPIDTNVESVRNEVAEKYIFKMIEEAVELRREFPSVMNPWSKHQKPADMQRIKEEFCDVLLFLMNFMIAFKLSPDEVLEEIHKVQHHNFEKIKGQMMDQLNQDITKVQNHVSGIGSGSLTPKVVFIGQNPKEGLTKGEKFTFVLPPGEYSDVVYVTNIVKSTTPQNVEPSEELTAFWKEFLKRELDILRANNPDMKIITIGRWADENLQDYPHMTYEQDVKSAPAHTD